MLERQAGSLIGELITLDFLDLDAGAGGTPCHGELVIAFDPQRFGLEDATGDDVRVERLLSVITDQGARLSSQRRYEARERSLREGMEISGPCI